MGRSSNGVGVNPLSFAEIASWCQLTGIELNPWELETIKSLDVAYLKIMNARSGHN